MKYAAITERLAGLAGAKWEIHARAKAMAAAGQSILSLTIGEPDVPPPTELLDCAKDSMFKGRVGYSNGRGEAALLQALSDRYSKRSGRCIGKDQIICLPGLFGDFEAFDAQRRLSRLHDAIPLQLILA